MTTPTQIEAADLLERDQVSEAFVVLNAEIDRLTAAAKVGEQDIERWKRIAMKAEEDANAMARDARVKEMSDSPRWDAALVALERSHTIERCAQVAEDLRGKGDYVAAAIRALKDKP